MKGERARMARASVETVSDKPLALKGNIKSGSHVSNFSEPIEVHCLYGLESPTFSSRKYESRSGHHHLSTSALTYSIFLLFYLLPSFSFTSHFTPTRTRKSTI